MISIRRTTMAVAAAALMTAGLTACSADDISEKVGEKVGEKVVEEQLGDDADVDIDTDSGEVTIEDGDGNSYTSGGDLPEDFPDDIPLVNAEILTAVGVNEGTSRGWSVSMISADDAQAIYDEASGLLADAGFAPGEANSATTGEFSNGTYTVVLVAFDNGDGNSTVGYTVQVS